MRTKAFVSATMWLTFVWVSAPLSADLKWDLDDLDEESQDAPSPAKDDTAPRSLPGAQSRPRAQPKSPKKPAPSQPAANEARERREATGRGSASSKAKTTPTPESVSQPPARPAKGAGTAAPIVSDGALPADLPAPPSAADEKIRFRSQGMRGLRSDGVIELLREVVVTQADTRIDADYVKAFFHPETSKAIKIEATGNVIITKAASDESPRLVATSDKAIYYNRERLVELNGNAHLWRGESLMRGDTMTYNIDTGLIEGDRVEGVVQPGGQ